MIIDRSHRPWMAVTAVLFLVSAGLYAVYVATAPDGTPVLWIDADSDGRIHNSARVEARGSGDHVSARAPDEIGTGSARGSANHSNTTPA